MLRVLHNAFAGLVPDGFSRFGALDQAIWVIATCALVVGLAFVISTGPAIQYYGLRLLRSEMASIYGSAYQSGLARFPSLRSWLELGLDFRFLAVSLAIVLSSLRRTCARQVFFSTMVSAFITLTLLDLVSAGGGGPLTEDWLLENLLANFIGSPIIAFIFTAIVMLGKLLIGALAGSIYWRRLMAAVVSILGGISICSAAYYVTDLLYRTPPIKMDVVLDAPVHGSIGTPRADRSKSNETDNQRRFLFFPQQPVDSSILRWKAGFERPLSTTWTSSIGSGSFSVAVEILADCQEDEFESLQSVTENVFHFPGASTVTVAFDRGMAEFATLGRKSLDGSLELNGASIAMFSMEREAKLKDAKTTLVTSEQMSITNRSNSSEINFYLNAPLLDEKNNEVVPADRKLQIIVDGKEYLITGHSPQLLRKADKLDCRTTPAGLALDQGTLIAEAYFGVRVRIVKGINTPTPIKENSVLKIGGQGGWLILTQPWGLSSSPTGEGEAEFVTFTGNVVSLDIADKPITARPIDEFQAFGKFKGHFDDASRVRLTGYAKALWKNATRVNTTKWEQLSETIHLMIFGGLSTALVAAVTFLWRIIQQNNAIDWRK